MRMNNHMLIARTQAPHTAFYLNIDPEKSSFSSKSIWPIFLGNILQQKRKERPGLLESNLRAGEKLVFQYPDQGTWQLKTPNIAQTLNIQKDIWIFQPEAFGLYHLSKDEQTLYFASNLLQGQESDLQKQARFHQDTKRNPLSLKLQQGMLTPLFAFSAWIFLLWNWRATRERT